MSFPVFLLCMFLVTYSTRVLPALLISRIQFSERAKLFLQLIPYTSMTALVFPAILSCDSRYLSIGLLGGLAAFLAAWNKFPVIVCVLIAVVLDFCMQQFHLFLF